MGVRERRARQKRYLRQEILDAASELFVREGFENVSMRRIADKIEYSPTTIYLYFKDKAALLEQVCAETFSRLEQRLGKILEQPGEPVERLRRGLLAYIEFGLENPHHYRATFMMLFPEGFDKEKYVRPDSPGMRAFDFLRRAVQDAIAAGASGRSCASDSQGATRQRRQAKSSPETAGPYGTMRAVKFPLILIIPTAILNHDRAKASRVKPVEGRRRTK